jgi:ATP-binding cassette subfamily C protein LapB
MSNVARHYRLNFSEEQVRVIVSQETNSPFNLVLEDMARQLGLGLRIITDNTPQIHPWSLPLIAELDQGQVMVLTSMDSDGNILCQTSGDGGLETTITLEELTSQLKKLVILRPLHNIPDARVDDYIKPYQKNWFWQLALKDWHRYGDIMVVAMMTNVLALAGMLFSMQVYDRVVPSQSESTLWVLFGGVMVAIAFEFIMRMLRVNISDVIGKRADLRISDRVFAHAMRIRSNAQPKSTGSFISQLRELESVRELITSTTISTVSDIPFFLLFVFILWIIGGPLVYVVLLAVPMLLIPGLLVQRPLGKLSNEGMRESAIRNATLVETIQGLDDIKLLRAEQRFQNQWNNTNSIAATISMKQRWVTSLLMTWTQEVQSIVYAVVLLVGCYLVISGDMTTGALVGTSILASRTIAPLSQISGVLSRWQAAKVARKGLDELMQRPTDSPDQASRVHKAQIFGNYQLKEAGFYYDEETKINDLAIKSLNIRPGERIALLGRNGCGKSTLLHVLAGMLVPQNGQVLLDGISIEHLDPADVRRDMQFLSQQSQLFFGSIRENLTLGYPMATDEEIIRALNLSGAAAFVQKYKDGLNHIIHEGGAGLSGGQRLSLMIARTLIRRPNIILLDEPSSALDEVSEKQFIDNMNQWLGKHQTLIVATHRLPILKLVDRVIVLDGGRIVMDSPRDKVLNEQQVHLDKPPTAPAKTSAPTGTQTTVSAAQPAETASTVSIAPHIVMPTLPAQSGEAAKPAAPLNNENGLSQATESESK